MPSNEHELVIETIREQPEMTPMFLREQLDVKLPAYGWAQMEPADLNDLAPTEFRADAVVTLREATRGRPVLGVVVEVQLSRDHDKRWVWPVYLATLRARLRCPAMLLVVCIDAAMARWCADPVQLGHPGLVLRPLVLGPDRVPVVTDVDQARSAPELAVLSALARAAHPDHAKILNTVAAALATTDRGKAFKYSEILLVALRGTARRHWEDLMTAQIFEFQSDYARHLKAEGRAEGEARLVLAVLDARGIDVPDDIRARITGCSDADQLEAWGRRAAVIRTIDELFE